MNYLKKSNLKTAILLLLLLFLYVFISAHSYVSAVSEDISQSVFRLHVLANSNSEEDQNLKLKVRDALLDYMNELCLTCSTTGSSIFSASSSVSAFAVILTKHSEVLA